jgi:hypothetical protein
VKLSLGGKGEGGRGKGGEGGGAIKKKKSVPQPGKNLITAE